MLAKKSAKYSETFQRELERVLADPIANADLWPWADFYSPDTTKAHEMIIAAGLDPVTLGQSRVL